MISFTNNDKRWLEIIFYLICRKVFSINQSHNDIISFINGYKWTNMFNYDTLVKAVNNEKILINDNFIPKKREFIAMMTDNDCRLRMHKSSIRKLIEDTEYTFWNKDVFRTAMKEEVNKTEFYPRLQTPRVHETIYSFLLALRYVADIIKTIKF